MALRKNHTRQKDQRENGATSRPKISRAKKPRSIGSEYEDEFDLPINKTAAIIAASLKSQNEKLTRR
jgi:hypothetical protein